MKKDFFNDYTFRGTHHEVGRQHGETLRKQIREHMELTYTLAERVSGVNSEKVLSKAKPFEVYIEKYAPGFLEEIEGLGEGANIEKEEALLLQIRQEVVYMMVYGKHAKECTSYAIGEGYTKNGEVYSGQNADLAGDFEAISNVIRFEVTGKPKIMMLVPAGQISYLGINSEGMSANCNFLPCEGWKVGYPRYLISRLLLESKTFGEALEVMNNLKERASSRNILLADYQGNIVNYETTATNTGRIEAMNCFVHSNHFIDFYMKQFETADELELIDSEWRRSRLLELIEKNKSEIDIDRIKEMLRDHKKDDRVGKFSICTHACAETDYYHTFASIINDLSNGAMEICKGVPCENEYKRYEF